MGVPSVRFLQAKPLGAELNLPMLPHAAQTPSHPLVHHPLPLTEHWFSSAALGSKFFWPSKTSCSLVTDGLKACPNLVLPPNP